MRTSRIMVLAALLAAAGCTDAGRPEQGGPQRDTGGIAVVALQTDLDAANMLVTADRYMQELLRYGLFLPLVHYTDSLTYAPALAESYEFSADTAVTFRLRRDVRWHDGARTTAHDVAFTFERAQDTVTAFPNADWLIGWGKPEVLDSFTVRFPLERMSDPLAGVAMLAIMPRHLLQHERDLRQAAFNRKPVGNGPYRFVEYRAGDRWVIEANPDYPEGLGGRPPLARIVFRVIPEATSQIAELRAGNVDLALSIPADQFRALAADPQLRGITRASRNYAFIAWNTRRPGLGDPRVRRALTFALDRPAMIALARAGQGEVAVSPVGRYAWAYHNRLQPIPQNQDSARTLLAAAGWGNGKLRLELSYPSNSAALSAIAELVRSDLSKVGVNVTLRGIEYGTLVERISSPDRPFDAVLMGWENDIRLNFTDMFHSASVSGPFQFASYRNPEVDRILDQASREPDRETARPLWERFQEIMRDEQPWTVLFHFADLYVARERLQGVEMDVRGAFVSLPRWWIQRDTL